jgi:hypothetical protein
MLGNQLRRGDGLGMVSGGGEWGEVAVLGDDAGGTCGDRAIGEFVVVRICGDELKAKGRADVADVSAGLLEEVDETKQLRGGSRLRNCKTEEGSEPPRKRSEEDFFVSENVALLALLAVKKSSLSADTAKFDIE